MVRSWRHHRETHRTERIGWLRAAVLGANDGILSTASLLLGVAGGGGDRAAILMAGVAGLVAGAMSMAAGEYVSVSSQSDTEEADLAKERHELATQHEAEHDELARIYQARGLERELATQVATQLMAHDALGAHARDELGIHDLTRARPVQAALYSAASFAAGALVPLGVAAIAPRVMVSGAVMASSLVLLAVLGAVAANAGGAPPATGAARVTFWGVVAMVVTYGIGALFGTVV
ncbi:MAG: VIT family protein [Burkholderiales bacterium]|nr:VIT family protein [Burkholderiales bacterium]